MCFLQIIHTFILNIHTCTSHTLLILILSRTVNHFSIFTLDVLVSVLSKQRVCLLLSYILTQACVIMVAKLNLDITLCYRRAVVM